MLVFRQYDINFLHGVMPVIFLKYHQKLIISILSTTFEMACYLAGNLLPTRFILRSIFRVNFQ